MNLTKNKKLYIFMVLFCIFVNSIFFQEWRDFFGMLLFSFIFIWNVFAFPRGVGMILMPRGTDDVSSKGGLEGRRFLFFTSIVLFLFLNIGWIFRYFGKN